METVNALKIRNNSGEVLDTMLAMPFLPEK